MLRVKSVILAKVGLVEDSIWSAFMAMSRSLLSVREAAASSETYSLFLKRKVMSCLRVIGSILSVRLSTSWLAYGYKSLLACC